MADRNLELALRIKADMAQAQSALRELESELRQVNTAAQSAGAGGKAAGAGLDAIGTGARRAKTEAVGVADELDSLTQRSKVARVAFSDLRNILIAGFAIHEVADFVGGLVEANVEAQRIQFTLQQVFGPDGAQQFAFVSDQAERLGLDLKTAAEGYATLAASAQKTGLQTKDLQKLFTGLSEAATVLHTSAQGTNAVMVQLAQGMSLGKLQMQDIRAIAQNLPGTMTLVSEAAQRMGINFQQAMQGGGLPAIEFLGHFADVLHERFGGEAVEASRSLNAELNRLKTTLFEAQTQGTGFAETFADAIEHLNETLNDPDVKQNLQELIKDLGLIATAAINAAGKIAHFATEVGNGIGIALAQLQTHGVMPNDQLGLAKNELSGINRELKQLQQYQSELSKPSGERAAVSDDVVRRMLGLDFGTQITPELIQQAIAQRQLEQKNLSAATKRLQSGQTGGPLVAGGKPSSGSGSGTLGTALPTGPDADAIRRAEKLAKQAADAQSELTQSLIGLQAQLSPTAAIWAKYNDQVAKANSEAALAKKAKGADAAAIDAQRDAVIGLAATIRDAALDQLAEKDREAWEALKRSFETPAEVRIDDALKQIAQLNDMLKTGVINAQQYHDALGQIGQKSVTGALPTYQGVDAAVAGPYGELQKNYQAQADLDAAFQAQKLALGKKFNDADEAQHAAHVAALAKLDEDYKTQNTKIEKARGNLQLTAASNLFGQLATLSSSHNKKMAAIGKAAAIAQAVIETYKSANEAYSALALIPYVGPALGAAAAGVAIAAGLANVAQIRSQSVGGYATGGLIRGPGTPTSDSIPILASDTEYMHRAAAVRYYGVPFMDAINNMQLPRFANGGLITPYANAPSPAQLGFTMPAQPQFRAQDFAANDPNGGAGDGGTTHIHVWSVEEAAEKMAQLPAFQKAVVHIVGDNPTTIQGSWSR